MERESRAVSAFYANSVDGFNLSVLFISVSFLLVYEKQETERILTVFVTHQKYRRHVNHQKYRGHLSPIRQSREHEEWREILIVFSCCAMEH